MKTAELKALIKEVIHEQEELNELAFTKKGKWNDAIKKAGNIDNLSETIVNHFFNELVNPENKNMTGLGAYIKIFQLLIAKKFDKKAKATIVNKILNELPVDNYVLIKIDQSLFDKLPSTQKTLAYKLENDIFYLKGLNKDTTSAIHGFGSGQIG